MSESESRYLDHDYADQLYTCMFEGLQCATSEQRTEIEVLREVLLMNLGVMSGLWPDKSEESMGKLLNYARWAFHVRMRISTLLTRMKGKEVNEEVAEQFEIPWDDPPFAEVLADYKERNGEGASLH